MKHLKYLFVALSLMLIGACGGDKDEPKQEQKVKFEIRNNIIYGVGQLEKESHITLPKGVTEVAEGAFASRKEIKSITFPNTLTKINKKAFANCSNLEQIELPKSLRRIESEAFSGSGLKELTIPSETEYVGSLAFALCSDLKTVRFSKQVEWHSDAFSFSQNLEKIYAHVEEPPAKKWEFLKSFFGTLYVPKASLEKYKEKYQYVNFKIEAIK